MSQQYPANHFPHLATVALLGWAVPGGGHFFIGDHKRGAVICAAILLTFLLGLWIGSIGVIDPVTGKIPYIGQVMNSPAVIAIGRMTKDGQYPVYGRPNEIGQIYTSIAGLLNLLCIVNAVYLAHLKVRGKLRDEDAA